MTRDETKELLMMIRAIYPNFNVKPAEMTPTINAWHMMLEDYPADAVMAALKIYVKTSDSGFAPGVSQLIQSLYKPTENDQLSEGEAWNLVRNAIRDSSYHAEERYAALPEIIQKAIGGPSMLREWGMTESDQVNTVIMSNFQRTYRELLTKEKFTAKVPEALTASVKQAAPGIGVANE